MSKNDLNRPLPGTLDVHEELDFIDGKAYCHVCGKVIEEAK
jgi:hypothetical protein